MDVPPEGAPVEGPKAGSRHTQSPAQIEHDEAMRERAHLEDDLPRVILAEISAFHAFLYYVHHGIGGGGTARFEVLRITASACPWFKKHELKQPWILERVLEEDLSHLRKPLLNIAGE